jgi:hypothetical protein
MQISTAGRLPAKAAKKLPHCSLHDACNAQDLSNSFPAIHTLPKVRSLEEASATGLDALLRVRVSHAGEAQQRGRNGADGDSHVQPGEEGALIGEESFGLDAHGCRARHGRRVPGLAAVEVPVKEAFLLLLLPKACTVQGQ